MTEGKEIWWREYRRRQCRQRKKVNLYVAIKSIFKRCLMEYVSSCSIVGLRQMSDPKTPFKERIVWFILFGGMCGIFFYFTWHLWFENLSTPLVVSMESSTFPITELDFPAVAVCNVNRISKKALYEFEEKILKRNVSGDVTETMTWQLGGLLDFTYNETFISNYIGKSDSFYENAENIITIMRDLAPSCEEMLLGCMWAGVRIDCKKLFTVQRTFRGHCCAFNYVLDYANATGIPKSTKPTTERQSHPGDFNGLNIIIDPLIEDYAYTSRIVHGIEILIFDSMHFADPNGGRMIQRIVEPDKAIYIQLQSVKQVATSEVRKYGPKTRKCLFHDERKEIFNDMYSYNACIVRCRIIAIQTICKCTPYFLPAGSDIPSCTLQQLPCLNKYQDKLRFIFPFGAERKEGLEMEFQDALYCPACYPDCEFINYKSKTFKIDLPQLYVDQGLKQYRMLDTNINMTNKCSVSIYHSPFHGVLTRLDAVSTWFEVVSKYGSCRELAYTLFIFYFDSIYGIHSSSSVGGMGGILIAISIFSIMEFAYFFIVKVVNEICNLFLNKI